MTRLLPIAALGLLLLAASQEALASTIYRWVDDKGQVHYSENVPERFRAIAKPVGKPAADPSAEEQRKALERARKEKAKAATIVHDQVQPPASAAATSSAPGKRPRQVPNDQTDCETWQRLYQESIDCFGPYRTVRGATKPEAFDVCNVVPEPPPTRCRQRIP